MAEADVFQPEWFSPPGEAVAKSLARSGMPLDDFRFEMDMDQEETGRLLDGRLEITHYIALRLEKALGVSASFWEVREAHYRKDMLRIAEAIPSDVARGWLRELPVKDMTSLGWIAASDHQTTRVAECLRYFDVPSISSYERRVEKLIGGAKLRTSASLRSKPASLATWLRHGEIEAAKIDCAPWNRERFQTILPTVRRLTLIRDPQKFLPVLRAACAEAGVALVVARLPSGCRASGATKFLSESKALLLLSFRHLSDDHFWFSFFHEAGHLLLHGKGEVFVEGEPHDRDDQEKEANDFAEQALLPQPWHRLLERLPPNKREIIRFAVRAGVSPGIVVGQLQHRGRIAHNYLNFLKRRFTWL